MRCKLLWGIEQFFGRPLSFCKDFVGSHTPGVWRRKELALWAVLASIFSVFPWVVFIPGHWCSFFISHPGFANYVSCACFVSENLFIWNRENVFLILCVQPAPCVCSQHLRSNSLGLGIQEVGPTLPYWRIDRLQVIKCLEGFVCLYVARINIFM